MNDFPSGPLPADRLVEARFPSANLALAYADATSAARELEERHLSGPAASRALAEAVVAAALLYGAGDYGRSICMAVQTGFDTDCNAATVGSILGMRGGTAAIGPAWTEPIRGELDTAIFGVGRVKLAEVAKKTLEHLPQAK